jgi:hypothetical protein
MAFRETVFNRDIATFDEADFTQAAAKRISQIWPFALPQTGQETDHWDDRLLRARRERPRSRAAEQRYERATLHFAYLGGAGIADE